MKSEGRSGAWGFTLRFFAYVFIVTALSRVDLYLLEGHVSRKLTETSAAAVALGLELAGGDARRSGSTLYFGGSAFRVIDECTGIEVMALFGAAILAFPSPWRRRLRGLAVGLPILIALNLVRMVTLVWLGASSARALELGHVYVWPVIVLTVALGLWLHWARLAVEDASTAL
ncbi:MAG: archaeosortase/exosortase family protein [Myxococcota bacterium]